MTAAPRKGPRERSVNSKLAALRIAAGLTQQQLADLVGVRMLAIGRWERGQCTPSGENLVKLAHALGVSVEEILA